MPRFACPDCGSEIIESREIVVSFRAQEVIAWNEDGTPAEVAEPHFEEEDIGGEAIDAELLDRMYGGRQYECGRCGRGLSGPAELERLD